MRTTICMTGCQGGATNLTVPDMTVRTRVCRHFRTRHERPWPAVRSTTPPCHTPAPRPAPSPALASTAGILGRD